MIKYLEKKFVLSPEGAKQMLQSSLLTAALNLSFILPVMVIFFFFEETVSIHISQIKEHYDLMKYLILVPTVLLIIFLINRTQYKSTYATTYAESAKKRVALSERIRKLPLSFFGKRDLADLTATIMGDMESMEHAYSHAVPQFFGTILSVSLITLSIAVKSPIMALALIWPFPIALILIHLARRKVISAHEAHLDEKLLVSDRIQEILENALPIKAYGYEEETLSRFNHQLNITEERQIRSEKYNPFILAPLSTLLRLGSLSLIFVGLHEYLTGQMPLFVYMTLTLAALVVYLPMDNVFSFIIEFMYVQVPAQRMKDIIDMDIMQGDEVPIDHFDITLKNVHFGYDEREVIKNVSFTAKQGETTALVGHSGCGKSTLARLMLRFWDVDKGTIELGGIDIRTIDPENLLTHYSMVFQDVVLFNNSVMENIRIGRKGASDEDVKRAARYAQVDDFVQNLPQGYDTPIGENGIFLSGGERQRISIARAILKDAPIIFLDESTSSVDADSETKLQEALSHLIQDKTVVVIAHRLRTVENADKIIVLEEGEIAEEGIATDLIAKKGKFYTLWKSQQNTTTI